MGISSRRARMLADARGKSQTPNPYFSVHSRLCRERRSERKLSPSLYKIPVEYAHRQSGQGSLMAIFLGGTIYPSSLCGSGGKHVKSAGTPSPTRTLSGTVGRYRIGPLTRFQGHHSASDRCLRHITVLTNFIESMMEMWLSQHSSRKKKERIYLPSSSSRPTPWQTTR